jgi:pimeloyl-ACP methyl ester carboxylesterase
MRSMENLRKYGTKPFRVAVIHGGPGAAGEMAPVARELKSGRGVLEPLQTEASLKGQIKELKTVLKQNGDLPITLIGFSWGAWLGFIFAARYPKYIKKLILIGSGPFEEKYASRIQEIRLSRLNEKEKAEARSLNSVLNHPAAENKDAALARLGALFSKADAHDPIRPESEASVTPDCRFEIYRNVWKEAEKLRKSGKLLELGKRIQCPVVAIHGDADPHPTEGVQKPLSAVIGNFRFILLKNCGHKPWIERQTRDTFFKILKQEMITTDQ